MGLVARFLGVITSPRETFAVVAASPKWLGMMVLTVLILAVFTALPMTTEAGKQATIDTQVKQMKGFGFEVSDQVYDQMEKGAARLPYTTALSVIVISPIFVVIVAGILFAVFNAGMGGEASFKQMFALLTHAGVISGTVSRVLRHHQLFPGSRHQRHESGGAAADAAGGIISRQSVQRD